MREHRDVLLEFLDYFIEYSLSTILRDQNIFPDDIYTSTSTCRLPFRPTCPYTVEVKNRPTIPDNIRYWYVFGDDAQIEKKFQSKDEFEDANIDIEFDVEDIVHYSVNKLEFHEIDEERQETNIYN